jgi:hypothetical protein
MPCSDNIINIFVAEAEGMSPGLRLPACGQREQYFSCSRAAGLYMHKATPDTKFPGVGSGIRKRDCNCASHLRLIVDWYAVGNSQAVRNDKGNRNRSTLGDLQPCVSSSISAVWLDGLIPLTKDSAGPGFAPT